MIQLAKVQGEQSRPSTPMEPLVEPLTMQRVPSITPRPRIEECADVQQWINRCDEMNKVWIGELVKGAHAEGMDKEKDEGMDMDDGAAGVKDEGPEIDVRAQRFHLCCRRSFLLDAQLFNMLHFLSNTHP